MDSDCPICSEMLDLKELPNFFKYADCRLCGEFRYKAKDEENLKKLSEDKKIVLRHWIRVSNIGSNEQIILPDFEQKKEFYNNLKLPDTAEKINNLIRYLGENSEQIGIANKICVSDLQAVIGIDSKEGLEIILNHFNDQKLIKFSKSEDSEVYELILIVEGWLKYESLKE